jgi:hypothetical protein
MIMPDPLPCHLEYAYTGNSAGLNHGRTHVVLDGPLKADQLVREPGDALCHPRSAFWGLSGENDTATSDHPTCTPCIQRSTRLVASGLLAPHNGSHQATQKLACSSFVLPNFGDPERCSRCRMPNDLHRPPQ